MKFKAIVDLNPAQLYQDMKDNNFRMGETPEKSAEAYLKALIEGALDPIEGDVEVTMKINQESINVAFNIERALSHSIQTSIQDPHITVPSVFVKEVIDIRDQIRRTIREQGYKGQF